MAPSIEVQIAEVRMQLRDHIILCDRRAQTLQKLAWFTATCSAAIIAYLVKIVAHFPVS